MSRLPPRDTSAAISCRYELSLKTGGTVGRTSFPECSHLNKCQGGWEAKLTYGDTSFSALTEASKESNRLEPEWQDTKTVTPMHFFTGYKVPSFPHKKVAYES